MNFDFDELEKQSEEAKDQRSILGVAGTALQGMAGAPSFYEIYKGRSVGNKPDVKGMMDAVASGITDPKEKAAKSMQLAKMAYENQKTGDEMAASREMNDPNSTVSKAYKGFGVARGWFSPAEAENMTAKQIQAYGDPKRLREIEAGADIDARKMQMQADMQAARDRADRQFQASEKAKDRQIDREKISATQAEKAFAADKENRQKAKEFQDRYANILSSLEYMGNLIDDKGTYEAFGDHESNLKANIEAIATDSAKLFDPSSVARPSEVEQFKKMFFEPGTLTTSNATAKKMLQNYKQMLERRAENFRNTYKQDVGSQLADKSSSKNGDADALRWAMQNPKDPRARAIMDKLGITKKTAVGSR